MNYLLQLSAAALVAFVVFLMFFSDPSKQSDPLEASESKRLKGVANGSQSTTPWGRTNAVRINQIVTEMLLSNSWHDSLADETTPIGVKQKELARKLAATIFEYQANPTKAVEQVVKIFTEWKELERDLEGNSKSNFEDSTEAKLPGADHVYFRTLFTKCPDRLGEILELFSESLDRNRFKGERDALFTSWAFEKGNKEPFEVVLKTLQEEGDQHDGIGSALLKSAFSKDQNRVYRWIDEGGIDPQSWLVTDLLDALGPDLRDDSIQTHLDRSLDESAYFNRLTRLLMNNQLSVDRRMSILKTFGKDDPRNFKSVGNMVSTSLFSANLISLRKDQHQDPEAKISNNLKTGYELAAKMVNETNQTELDKLFRIGYRHDQPIEAHRKAAYEAGIGELFDDVSNRIEAIER